MAEIPFSSQGRPPEIEWVFMDFDGTLINENTLITWVKHLLTRPDLPMKQKIPFFFKSVKSGFLSIALSSWAATSERAVRIAFQAFKGIEKTTLDELFQMDKGRPAITLNPNALAALKTVMEQNSGNPGIKICSQGSSGYAIRQFLNREDVRAQFRNIGVDPDAIHIEANDPETDGGRFTGQLNGNIHTKYNRMLSMGQNAVFIGDDRDQAILKNMENQDVAFVNWKQVSRSSGPAFSPSLPADSTGSH
jgi:hypothetical protein